MNNRIVVLAGDGIGPEIMDSGLKILAAVEKNAVTLLNLKNFPLAVQVSMKRVLHYQKKHWLLVEKRMRSYWEQLAAQSGKKWLTRLKKDY